VVEPNLLLLPTEPHHDTSAVSLPPIAGELNRTWCDVQVQSPDSFSSQSESVNTKRDILRILRGPESRLCDTTAMYLLNHEEFSYDCNTEDWFTDIQVVEANLQLLPTEPRHDTSAVSLESSHFKDTEDRLTGIQAVVPYHELLPTTSHDEPSAFVLSVNIKMGYIRMRRGPECVACWLKTTKTCYLNHMGFPYDTRIEDCFTGIKSVSGRVTEYLCCNRMEASVIVALEDFVHTFKKVTCTYLRVTEDGQVDTDTWVTEGVYSPHSSQSNSEEGEERFSPEEVEVPFISCQLSDREVTDIGLKLPALRQAFATILSSDHNQNFLFLNGRKIVMRLAAANNQDTVRVQSAYEALIWFLRTSSNQESIAAELSGANLHFNFVDVFYELLVFGYFCNGLAPETFEGGFLQRLMAFISMWDLDVWEPAAGLYFTVLITILSSDHNQNFLFLNGKKIVMRLAAANNQVVLPDDWETTAEVIRETGRKVLGVSSGRRKEEKETWWWNEEVQDSIQRKRLAKKKWDMDRTEENRQEYKELQRRVKREVSKAKQKAYDELYTRLGH
ncbi:hypothetical protein QTP70_018318, partial [Hemibagrus guttatus]